MIGLTNCRNHTTGKSRREFGAVLPFSDHLRDFSDHNIIVAKVCAGLSLVI